MQWRDLFALAGCLAMVYWLGKSVFFSKRPTEVPLRGKLSAARNWLDDNGYQIVRVRDRVEFAAFYGDKEYKKSFIADFVVRKGAKYYAVKLASARDTGVSGAKLREQWFPVYVVFGVQGILRIDVDEERVQVIDFSWKTPGHLRRRAMMQRLGWFLLGVLVAMAWLHGG